MRQRLYKRMCSSVTRFLLAENGLKRLKNNQKRIEMFRIIKSKLSLKTTVKTIQMDRIVQISTDGLNRTDQYRWVWDSIPCQFLFGRRKGTDSNTRGRNKKQVNLTDHQKPRDKNSNYAV